MDFLEPARINSVLFSIYILVFLMVFFEQSEAECFLSDLSLTCKDEAQKSIVYQYHLRRIDNAYNNITTIDIVNSDIPAVESFLDSLPDDVIKKVRKIILRNCSIKEIPENAFVELEDLEVLDLSDNALESMAFLETVPKAVREIYLRHAKIQKVPDTFSQLENLEIVDFSYCNIDNLDFTVFRNNVNLILVNASHNNITSSMSGEYLKNIKCVDLSYNNLSMYNNIPSFCLDLTSTNMLGYQWYNISSRNKSVFIDNFFYSGNEHLRLVAYNKKNYTLPIEISYLNVSNFRGRIPPDLDLQQVKVKKELILRNSNISSLDKASYDFKNLFFDGGSNATFDLSSSSIFVISPLYFENYNLGQLNLCHNEFKRLGNSCFKDARIIQLDLCNSTIETIDKEAFSGLYTHTLNLSLNSIDDLDFLRGIRDVYVLDLAHNILKSIPPDCFSSLNNVRIIDLSYNLIETIGEKSFQNDAVEVVYLNNNKLYSIRAGTFENIPRLRQVYLHQNPVSVIEANSFKSLPDLRFMNLGNMGISVIQPSAFNDLQNLRILYLNDNKLIDIPRIFLNIPNLEEIDLTGNSLEGVKGLIGLNLETLRISIDDKFQCDTFYMPTLKYMFIVDSNLQNYENPGLFGLEKLYIINSQNVAMKPDTFSGYFNVKQLNEREIFANIEVIPQYTFKDMRSLSNLDLSALVLKTIKPKAFVGLKQLEYLSVAKNYIIALDDYTFSGLHNLKSLDVSDNNIAMIRVAAFDSLENVNTMHLNRNNISVIPIGTFHNLHGLNQLDLSHNKIEKLGVGIFTNLRQLRTLDISNNQLQIICDGTFIPLVNLEHLNLEGNHISRFGAEDILVFLPRIRSVGIGRNDFDCNNLKRIVLALDKGNVSLRPENESSFYSYNIVGIACKNPCD